MVEISKEDLSFKITVDTSDLDTALKKLERLYAEADKVHKKIGELFDEMRELKDLAEEIDK